MSDDFDAIVAGIEIDIDPASVLDVSKLDTPSLAAMQSDIEDELYEMGQALRPETQRARDLHSRRNAVQVELNKRIREADK